MVALMALFLPLFWIALLTWVFSVVGLRTDYSRLWHEHEHMKHLMDQGQENVRSTSGESLGTMFEYVYLAQADYLNALELVFKLGVAPALLVWFIVGYRGVMGSLTKRAALDGVERRAES